MSSVKQLTNSIVRITWTYATGFYHTRSIEIALKSRASMHFNQRVTRPDYSQPQAAYETFFIHILIRKFHHYYAENQSLVNLHFSEMN